MKWKIPILILVGLAISVGALNASYFLWGEFQNNNQGEYFDPVTGIVDGPYTAVVFMVAFVPVFVVTFLVGLALYSVARLIVLKLK